MGDMIIDALADWIKSILTSGILSNLSDLFGQVNDQVTSVAGVVGQTPMGWNAAIFNMIKNISDTVILPIAGLILSFVMTLELIQIIMGKVIFGIAVGYLVDLLSHFHFHRGSTLLHDDHAHSESIWKETLSRTASVTLFIFIVNFALTALMHVFTEEHISSFMHELGMLQPVLCALIGFIPNCASSVLLCELYMHGFITLGSLFSGLVCNAGLGLTIFFRVRGAWKDLVVVMLILFAGGILCGLLM